MLTLILKMGHIKIVCMTYNTSELTSFNQHGKEAQKSQTLKSPDHNVILFFYLTI